MNRVPGHRLNQASQRSIKIQVIDQKSESPGHMPKNSIPAPKIRKSPIQ